MKKKGFTLIELLAVIVILAIIALIAIPVITNVIEKAKKGAAESSALGYLSAVENQVAINAVDTSKENIVDGNYEVSALSTKGVSVKGNGPTSGTVTITKGQVASCSLVIDKYTVTCLGNGKVQVGGEIGITTENPDLTKTKGLLKIVYLDPTDYTKKCDSKNSISTTGTKEGCMKWYAYAETDTTYDLILDHNTTALVAWNSSGKSADGMNEVKTALEIDTKNWIEESRLISADEIAEITGAKAALDWTSDKTNSSTPVLGVNVSWFYLDGAAGTDTFWKTKLVNEKGMSKYAWLFDNTYECTNYGCDVLDNNKYEYGISGGVNNIYAYWTSNIVVGHTDLVWCVYRDGYLSGSGVNKNDSIGLRPVITIPKSLIS